MVLLWMKLEAGHGLSRRQSRMQPQVRLTLLLGLLPLPAAGRSCRQRVVNQPSASVTELGKELRRGESLLLMKETSVLIESGYSPAARDRLRRLIHIACFAPLL